VVNAQANWPVFFVTSEVFSGSVCGKLDLVFVFKSKNSYEEALCLERMMALENCNQSFEMFPENESGLFQATEQYALIRSCLPIRI